VVSGASPLLLVIPGIIDGIEGPSSFFFITLGLELSDKKVYEP